MKEREIKDHLDAGGAVQAVDGAAMIERLGALFYGRGGTGIWVH